MGGGDIVMVRNMIGKGGEGNVTKRDEIGQIIEISHGAKHGYVGYAFMKSLKKTKKTRA